MGGDGTILTQKGGLYLKENINKNSNENSYQESEDQMFYETDENKIDEYFQEYTEEVCFMNDSFEHKNFLLNSLECFKEWLEEKYNITID